MDENGLRKIFNATYGDFPSYTRMDVFMEWCKLIQDMEYETVANVASIAIELQNSRPPTPDGMDHDSFQAGFSEAMYLITCSIDVPTNLMDLSAHISRIDKIRSEFSRLSND